MISKSKNIDDLTRKIDIENEIEFNGNDIIPIVDSDLEYSPANSFKTNTNLVDKPFLYNHNESTINFDNLTNVNQDKRLTTFGGNTFLAPELLSSYDGFQIRYTDNIQFIYDKFYKKIYSIRISRSNQFGNDPDYGNITINKSYCGEQSVLTDASTHVLQFIEYHPPFLADEEFIDKILSCGNYGFLARIRNINDVDVYKYYFILHNNSGNQLYHTYIDFTDFRNYHTTSKAYAIYVELEDNLIFTLGNSFYSTTICVFSLDSIDPNTHKPSTTLLIEKTGINIYYTSSDVVYDEEVKGWYPSHTMQPHLTIVKVNNIYYINRLFGPWVYNGSTGHNIGYCDYFKYDVTNNTLYYKNENYTPIHFSLYKSYLPFTKYNFDCRQWNRIFTFLSNYCYHVYLNEGYNNAYFYEQILSVPDIEQFMENQIDYGNYCSVVQTKQVFLNDSSYIGKALMSTAIFKFQEMDDDLLITYGKYVKNNSLNARYVSVFGFDRNNPIKYNITKIEPINFYHYLTYYLNNNKETRVYKLFVDAKQFARVDNYNDFRDANYTIYHTYTIDEQALLNTLVQNYRHTDDTDISRVNSKVIKFIPFMYNNNYFVKWAYTYWNEDYTARIARMFVSYVDQDMNIISNKYVYGYGYSSYVVKMYDFYYINSNFIYENDTHIYLIVHYYIARTGGSPFAFRVVRFSKSDYSMDYFRGRTYGMWAKEFHGVHEKYGYFYTNTWPNYRSYFYYYVDDSITDFNQRMVDALENTSLTARSITPILQCRGSSGFSIGWNTISIYYKQKSYTLEFGTIELDTIKEDPSNSTFYVYIEYDNVNDKFEVKAYETEQEISEYRYPFGIVHTDTIGISSSENLLKLFYLNNYSVSYESVGNSLPTTDDNNEISKTVLPYSCRNAICAEVTTISANSYTQFNLDVEFGTKNRKSIYFHVYEQSGTQYVDTDTYKCSVSSDMKTATIYNTSSSDKTFLIIMEELADVN